VTNVIEQFLGLTAYKKYDSPGSSPFRFVRGPFY